AESPSPFRARQLETWRGLLRSQAGDAAGMRAHLERAAQLAQEQGLPAARCEALALMALEASRFGAADSDEELLALAERAAAEAKTLREVLPGHPLWGAQADAALARVALARGDEAKAVELAMAAIEVFEASKQEDMHVEILLPVAEAVMQAGTDEQKGMVGFFLRLVLTYSAQRTLDERV